MGLSHSRNYRKRNYNKIIENNLENPLSTDNNVSTRIPNEIKRCPDGIKRFPDRSLHDWSFHGYYEEVIWLIENGSNVNEMDQFGRTPLYLSVGYPKIAKALLDNGCSLSSIDIHEKTPLIEACQRVTSENIKFFKTIKLFISNGSDVNAKDIYKNTSLYYASNNEKIDIVNLLIQNGADVNTENILKETPLFNASSKGRIDTVNLLLQNGAERYHKNINGKTAYEKIPKCFKEMMSVLK